MIPKRFFISLVWMLPIVLLQVATAYIWWVEGDGRLGLVMYGYFMIATIPVALTIEWIKNKHHKKEADGDK
jgi:hypothetical protein